MKKLLCVGVCLLLLTGCWDVREYKNIKLVLSLGFDKVEDGKLLETVSIPSIQKTGEGSLAETVQVISNEADTPRAARDATDQMVAESFDPSKVLVVLLGEDLAKDNMQPIFDEFIRNPNNNLNAYIAIVEGKAENAIKVQPPSEPRVSEYIRGLLDALVAATHSSGEDFEMVYSELLEPGVDSSIPLLEVDQERQLLNFKGMALLHEHAYTGEYIPHEDVTLLMLMNGRKGKIARFTERVTDEEETRIRNYLTYHVMSSKRKMKVDVKDGQVTAKINLKLNIRVVEYPRNHLSDKKTIKKLNKKLSEIMTEDAKRVVKTLQEANSDMFSIGRRIKAYHPNYWDQVDWNEEYPNINIVPKVDVEILQYGVVS